MRISENGSRLHMIRMIPNVGESIYSGVPWIDLYSMLPCFCFRKVMIYFSMLVGIGCSHDAGVVFADPRGKVLWAAGEERFTRKKSHDGFPFRALDRALLDLGIKNDTRSISNVIFGTYGRLTLTRAKAIVASVFPLSYPTSNFGKSTDIDSPGRSSGDLFFQGVGDPLALDQAALEIRVNRFIHEFLKDRFGILAPVSFVVHHDSHAAAVFFASGFKRSLVLSFDGQGDGESGIIGLADRECRQLFEHQVRMSASDSLGHLYGATTNRYGMKSNRHEGKILGLAALGKHTSAVDQIERLVSLKDGVPSVHIPFSKEFDDARGSEELQSFRFTDFLELYFKRIETEDFPDLAFAVQQVLEKTVLQVAHYWTQKYKVRHLALTGGVFANVKVNQLLAESLYPCEVYIYPNMSDGGLPAGAIWYWLHTNGKEVDLNPHPVMYSGPNALQPAQEELEEVTLGISLYSLPSTASAANLIASLISKNFYCGIVEGRMEFGPRALGHRSILADPRSRTVNYDLNKRLQRTEYMPFAPVCLPEAFTDLFETSKHASLIPFYHMTMLCKVNEKWVSKIPAVVHVDGTARPQYLLKEENEVLHMILDAFRDLTGIPCLVNTSFNLHEEPIVDGLADALRSLRSRACDFVVFDNSIYYLYGDKRLEAELLR